jgi:Domain of unknown function (DUF4157)
MSTHAVHDGQSTRDARRGRRKRANRSTVPEPKRVVGGAGQPLDLSVRRELEERLGYDFGRVRLHTDRDADALTGLLGADAVAVGPDIFFRAGAYRPGTVDGRRLLAHELLHTVQAPHGLGALKVGRDGGAVSLPEQPAERTAEQTARNAERPDEVDVQPEAPTPGWMRYATVTADRMRVERLDPATLADRLAADVLRSLRGDPSDLSGRVRMRLARMSPQLRESILDKLETRLFSFEYDRLLELVETAEQPPLGYQPADTPAPVPDAVDQAVDAYRARIQQLESDRRSQRQRDEDTGEEREEAKERDEQRGRELSQAQQDVATEDTELAQRTAVEDERAAERERMAEEQAQANGVLAAERREADTADAQRATEQRDDAESARDERKEQREREESDPAQAAGPGADKRQRADDERKPAGGSRREDVDPKARERSGPVRPERVDERAQERDSPLTRHGLNEKDEDEGDPREEELPIGLEAGADTDIGDEDADEAGHGGGGVRGEVEIKPEDHLPETDLDVSGVPTADQIQVGAGGAAAQPAMPTFPAPPPTKAERLEAQREDAAEQDEDDEEEAETKAPGEEQGPVEGEAPKPEGGPAAEAADRSERDLQPDKPLDSEVGPDPETGDRQRAEPEDEQPRDPQSQQDADAGSARRGEDPDEERDGAGDGTGAPDAKDTQDEQQERKDADGQEERRDAAGHPEGNAADKPLAGAGTGGGSQGAAALRPAGARTEPTPAEDRRPGPPPGRTTEQLKADNEAPAAPSRVAKETGPGAAPSGESVGGSERAPAQSSVAAGPGGAPAAQAAVSPAAGTQAPDKTGAQAPEGGKAAPDASPEAGGGGCAPPAPAPEKDEGRKCSPGGGGEQAPEQEKPEPPDVAAQEPKTALATVSKLPPDEAQAALPGVDAAANHKVGEEHKRLQANPPTRERPSGAPQTQSAPPPSAPPAPAEAAKLERVSPEPEGKKQEAKGGPKATGAQPTENVPIPEVSSPNGQIDAGDAASIEEAADQVPTTDPELRNKTVGPAPKIRLEGESDPQRTDKQVRSLKTKQGRIQRVGREDAGKPLGEDKIYPNAPREQLAGAVTGGGPRGGVEPAGPAPKAGIGVVAQQERGPQVRAGANQAHTRMASEERKQQQGEQQAKRQKQTEIDAEVERNAAQQTQLRGRTADQAQTERTQWRDEQDARIRDADTKSEQEHTAGNKKIVDERDNRDKEIVDRKDADNQNIDGERVKAEKEAERKKEEKKDDSGGLLGKIVGAIGDFFKGLLDAVTKVFEAARKVVNGIIDGFKKFANGLIDAVRDFVVAAINVLADALIAIADVLLAAFPELRDRFRRAIEGLRDRAIAAVNRLAEGLKAAVNKLLDALGGLLNGLLNVLEAGLKAAINVYRAVIVGALKFAQAAIAAFGQFAALVADIAPDPGGWIAKAGGAMKTGVTDYLWGAIKTAARSWFDAKVEGILGLGKAIINVLVKGCLSMKQIAKMAWDAIIASLPMIIISLVIEKVVSLIVPAAGAILTIIQGLMAAWQSISSILTAFSKFWTFLKGVKAGPAACLFADFVAAGVVALIDFIANFLLIRLSMATKGVGRRLKAMAQKIMKGLQKTGKGARKAAGAAVNRARGAARKAAQAVRRPAGPAKPKGPRVPPRSKTAADRGPGGTRRPPGRRDQDRPPSRTPDRQKDRRRDQDQAKRERDRERVPAMVPPRRPPTDRAPEARRPAETAAQSPTDTDTRRPTDTDTRRPGDRDPGRGREAPSKKPKETDAPKRAEPKPAKSRVGRAVGAAKRAAKGALSKARNALRALGRKLRKSKVGRALRTSAKKLRDVYRGRRGRLRDQHRSRRRDRTRKRQDDRRRRDKTPDSKQQRLNGALARIRPLLGHLLNRGTYRSTFRAVLAGMKAWYRLTSLAPEGFPRFDTIARLNPTGSAGRGEYEWRKERRAEPEHGPQRKKTPANRNRSPATGRNESANPYGVRRDWPRDPTTGERLTKRDFKFLGWRMKQVRWWMRGEAPMGMTPETYQEWRSSLLKALERDGIAPDDVDVRLLGSASEGFSGPRKPLWTDEELAGRPRAQRILREWLGDDRTRLSRRPFDSGYRFGVGKIRGGERSDYDTNISGDKLVQRAHEYFESLPDEERPQKFFSGSHEYVNKDLIAEVFPNLQRWARDWSNQLGREVSHAVFRSTGPTYDPNFATHFRDDVDWIVHRPGGP